MKVMIAGRDISHLEKTVEEIRAMGAQGAYRGCDVSKSEDVEVLVKDAVAYGDGKLDVVVHAAVDHIWRNDPGRRSGRQCLCGLEIPRVY